MAANRFATMLHRSTHRMVLLLIYTVLEWILIALLLLNAIFSYLIAKFASFFGLIPPCVLCARVDHLFEPGKGQSSYRNLLCESHAREVSNLGFCFTHRRLSKASDMCEDCAASNPGETDQNVSLLSWMKRSEVVEKNLCCSCCGVALECGSYSSCGFLKFEPWDVLECAMKDRSAKEDKEEEKDDALGPVKVELGNKILSAHLAEVQSEEGGEEVEDQKGEIFLSSLYNLEDASVEILATHLVKIDDEERLLPIELIDSSTMMSCHPRGNEANDMSLQRDSLEPDCAKVDINEIAVQQTSMASSDLIESRHISPTTGVLFFEGDSNASLPTNELSEDISIDSSSTIPQEASDFGLITTKDVEDLETQHSSEEESKVIEEVNCEISIGSDICEEQVEHGTIHQPDPSPELLHDQETINLVTEQKCSALQVNLLTVPTVLYDVSEEGMPETPSTPYYIEGIPVLSKRFLLERRESGTESLDGSIASDLESVEPLTLDRLKAALKAERKSLTALYTELEEERSASAIAANQTMAMITRLQEEKAAMQMEALQYQRMMEEQSEYDQEALQLLNELMIKREKEKHELERELDLYREKVLMYDSRERRKNKISLSFEDSDDLSIESHEEDCNYHHDESNHNTPFAGLSNYVDDPVTLDAHLAEVEENRLSIFAHIKTLKEKLFKMDDEDDTNDIEPTKHYLVENGHGTHGETKLLGDALNGMTRKSLLPLFDIMSPENESKIRAKFDLVDRSLSDPVKKPYIVEEVNQVYQRLQALEADHDFLKHCISSLKNGEKWVTLLQEILRNIHDLNRLHLHARSSGI